MTPLLLALYLLAPVRAVEACEARALRRNPGADLDEAACPAPSHTRKP